MVITESHPLTRRAVKITAFGQREGFTLSPGDDFSLNHIQEGLDAFAAKTALMTAVFMQRDQIINKGGA